MHIMCVYVCAGVQYFFFFTTVNVNVCVFFSKPFPTRSPLNQQQCIQYAISLLNILERETRLEEITETYHSARKQ